MKNKIFVLASLSMVCLLAANCRKKNQAPSYPYNNTQKMGGMRHWTGVNVQGLSGPSTTDSVFLNYEVTPLTSTTVSMQGKVLNYASYSEAEKYMLFIKKNTQDSTALEYYFEADSMSYYHYERVSLCCYSSQQWNTRK